MKALCVWRGGIGVRGCPSTPTSSPGLRPLCPPGLMPLCLPGWAAVMLGAAYQVRAEPLSLAVSAHYPTHPSRSPARPACPQLCPR